MNRFERKPIMQQVPLEQIQLLLKEKQISLTQKEGIWIAKVNNQEEGLALVKDILYMVVDQETLIFLSGGSTPKPLYQTITQEGRLLPGAVAMVDERYVPKGDDKSNETMMDQVGLLAYLAKRNVPFYGVLQEGLTREQTAEHYNKVLNGLLVRYTKKITLLGIGDDGHTSGIAPNRPDFTNPVFEQNELVASFRDTTGSFGQRVTTTFKALSQMGFLMPLVFGEKKRQALKQVFTHGSLNEVPARFYTQPPVAPNTLLITDQKI